MHGFSVCGCVCRYQKLWKQYIRLKHLAANKPKVLPKDREKLRALEDQLQEIRLKGQVSVMSYLRLVSARKLRPKTQSEA